MASACEDLLSYYASELDLDYEWSCVSSSHGQRESGLGWPLLTWCPISVSKCVSNLYLSNLDNSVIEKKQSEMCFHFLDDLCAKWCINKELSAA